MPILEEFLKMMDISQYRLAKDIGVPPMLINKIVLGWRRDCGKICSMRENTRL